MLSKRTEREGGRRAEGQHERTNLFDDERQAREFAQSLTNSGEQVEVVRYVQCRYGEAVVPWIGTEVIRAALKYTANHLEPRAAGRPEEGAGDDEETLRRMVARYLAKAKKRQKKDAAETTDDTEISVDLFQEGRRWGWDLEAPEGAACGYETSAADALRAAAKVLEDGWPPPQK